VKVGLISDVHANLVALEAVLAQMGPVDALWVCGDTVGYGPDPSDVLALLVERKATIVAGNHDRAVARGEDLDFFNPPAAVAAKMHQRWLSSAERHAGCASANARDERRDVVPRKPPRSAVGVRHESKERGRFARACEHIALLRRPYPRPLALPGRRQGTARPREVRHSLRARPPRVCEPRQRGSATRWRSACRVRGLGPCAGHGDLPSFTVSVGRDAAPDPGTRPSLDLRGSPCVRPVSSCLSPRSGAVDRGRP